MVLSFSSSRRCTIADSMASVFYSWQSDRPKSQQAIRDALKAAIQALNAEAEDDDVLELDEATRNVPGAPEIAATILEKIDNCTIFVADITPISRQIRRQRPLPNPNVLIELGYAFGTGRKGRRIILVADQRYLPSRSPEALPFDLRHRRIRMLQAATAWRFPRRLELEQLGAELQDDIADILATRYGTDLLERLTDQALSVLESLVREWNETASPWATRGTLAEIGERLHLAQPDLRQELARLDSLGLVAYDPMGPESFGRCDLKPRGILLIKLRSAHSPTIRAYQQIATCIAAHDPTEHLGLSIGKIAQQTDVPPILTSVILDLWAEHGLFELTQTAGGDGFLECVSPLLAKAVQKGLDEFLRDPPQTPTTKRAPWPPEPPPLGASDIEDKILLGEIDIGGALGHRF